MCKTKKFFPMGKKNLFTVSKKDFRAIGPETTDTAPIVR